MDSAAVITTSLSRPKVHRPPAFVTAKSASPLQKFFPFCRRLATTRPTLFTLGALISLAVLAALLNGFISLAFKHIHGLPRFSYHKDVSTEGLLSSALAATPSAAKPAKTIVINGKDGTLIGQMTTLSPDSSQMAEVNSVDKTAGRELLSIVSKY